MGSVFVPNNAVPEKNKPVNIFHRRANRLLPISRISLYENITDPLLNFEAIPAPVLIYPTIDPDSSHYWEYCTTGHMTPKNKLEMSLKKNSSWKFFFQARSKCPKSTKDLLLNIFFARLEWTWKIFHLGKKFPAWNQLGKIFSTWKRVFQAWIFFQAWKKF